MILAIIAANTSLSSAYESLFHTKLSFGLGTFSLSLDLRHWISDGLMAFFFLVVGLELSRELDRGELKKFRTAALPFAAAVGGMLVPALMYTIFNYGTDSMRGWAIPTATDIALAVGVLALLGKRIPSSIRIFLLTLAIVDDVLAVIIIAIFYSTGINVSMLLIGSGIATMLYGLRNSKYMNMPLYILAGISLWIVVYQSGIHSSITGAILGLLAPLVLSDKNEISIAVRTERAVIPFTTLLVVPLFAFANTGIPLSLESFQNEAAINIAGGVIVGLVAGKVIGIVGASWLMVKLGVASLPARSSWNQIIGVGMLAGIGFTVSIFVADLAFANDEYVSISKISIFAASALSAAIGYVSLRYMNAKTGVFDIDA